LFEEVGVPHLVEAVEIDASMYRYLVQHEAVGYLSFIGQHETGMKIYEDTTIDSFNDVSLRFAGKDAAVKIYY